MIDWDKYDPARDANEEETHLCNSLNGCFGFLKHLVADPAFKDVSHIPVDKKYLNILVDYGERAQAVISYLRQQLEEKA
jgi:hypothetical protein